MSCCHDGSCTGHKVDDATRGMMKYMFSNELAMEYNMFGRHGGKKNLKACVFSTLCMRLLLKKNPLTSKVNLQEVETASQWFIGTRDKGHPKIKGSLQCEKEAALQ